jgi:hypothetical protein
MSRGVGLKFGHGAGRTPAPISFAEFFLLGEKMRSAYLHFAQSIQLFCFFSGTHPVRIRFAVRTRMPVTHG